MPHRNLELARRLILEHGWNSTCYQLINEGIEHWFSPDQLALVGFVRAGRLAIVAGAPVCTDERLAQTVTEWELYAASQNLVVCYFGAESRLQDHLGDSPEYVQVVLGSQPIWEPSGFVAAIQRERSLRAQLYRARNKLVQVAEWSCAQAENHPEIVAVLHEWLGNRGLPPLHFLVEPETLGNLFDRRIFVAVQRDHVIGFVTLCPIPAQNGWLTEQFVRSRRAPNGTIELLLHFAAESVAKQDYRLFTMGIVPLLSHGSHPNAADPRWLRIARGWANAHYTRFYNFRGLNEFKTKFNPESWEPVVVIVKDRRFRLSHLRAIGRAFTQMNPEVALLKGVWKAMRAETAIFGRFLSRTASKSPR